mmetsp:Transcript_17853/g.52114  ORF Transcript_17853/g.52114 Transcript_17853/m.52114 type:complete len:202 (-) Transcript_17853:1214-1819(-)
MAVSQPGDGHQRTRGSFSSSRFSKNLRYFSRRGGVASPLDGLLAATTADDTPFPSSAPPGTTTTTGSVSTVCRIKSSTSSWMSSPRSQAPPVTKGQRMAVPPTRPSVMFIVSHCRTQSLQKVCPHPGISSADPPPSSGLRSSQQIAQFDAWTASSACLALPPRPAPTPPPDTAWCWRRSAAMASASLPWAWTNAENASGGV